MDMHPKKGSSRLLTFSCMNTTIYALGIPENHHHIVRESFIRAEDILSRFKSNSELSQLNRTKNVPFIGSNILFESIKTADFHYDLTDGIYNPYMGKQLSSLGYNCSFEEIHKPAINHHHITPSYFHEKVQLDTKMKIITITDDIQIDLGGIAKGWTAQCIADLLKKEHKITDGALIAGGDICVWGTEKQNRKIVLNHPDTNAIPLYSFHLIKDAGVATSSIKKRSWTSDNGDSYHHILNPQTGLPAASDLIQATIIAPTLTEAEILTKCLLILGWEDGNNLCSKTSIPYVAIALSQDGEIMITEDKYSYTSEGVKKNE